MEENGLWEEKALGVVVRRLEIFEREDLARGRWVRYRLRRRVSKMDEPLIGDRRAVRSESPREASAAGKASIAHAQARQNREWGNTKERVVSTYVQDSGKGY